MRHCNRKFSQRKFFLAVLIVLFSAQMPVQALAMGWDALNPMSWFESDADKARKQAHEAELKAKDAEYRAQYAKKQAEKLRQEADAAKSQADKISRGQSQRKKTLESVSLEESKPVEAASAQEEIEKKEEKEQKKLRKLNRAKQSRPLDYLSEAHDGASENTSDPDPVLEQPEEVVGEDYEPNISEQAETPTRQSVSETTPALKNQVQKTIPVRKKKKRSMWNPINWFRSSEEQDNVAVANTDKPRVMMMQASSAKIEETASEQQHDDTQLALRKEGRREPQTSLTPLPQGVEQSDRQFYEDAKKYRAAVLETQRGNIVIELLPDEAPITATNFVKLTENGFYNQLGMKFHRVIPGFVVQTGDPTGTGAGGSKDRIPLEVKNRLSHDTKGVVAMARGATPDSATSQFYITLAPQKSLDAKYAIFGRVIQGFDVLEKIEKDDRFYGVKMVDSTTITREEPDADKQGFFKKIF